MVTTIFALTVWRMFANYSQTMAEGVSRVRSNTIRPPGGAITTITPLIWDCLLTRVPQFWHRRISTQYSDKLPTSAFSLLDIPNKCFYSFKICEGFLPNRHAFKQIVFTLKLVHLSTKPMSQLKHSTSYSWAPAVITFLHHCHMSRGFTSFYNNQMSLHKDKGECTPLTYSINCTTIYQGPLEGGCSLVQGVSVYIMT